MNDFKVGDIVLVEWSKHRAQVIGLQDPESPDYMVVLLNGSVISVKPDNCTKV